MSSIFLYIESNIIFVILLIVLLVNLGKSDVVWEERLFRNAMICNIFVLLADTGCWIFDGRIFADTLWLNKLVYCCYYVMTAIFVFVWMLYIMYKLEPRTRLVHIIRRILYVPAAAACIMAVVSLWNGWLYRFDSEGVYIRGKLFMVHTVILWIYLLTVAVLAVRALLDKERNKRMREGTAIIISVIFPVVGGILQTVYYGLNLAWTCSSVSFVVLFLAIQNKQMVTDSLTGVYNRGCMAQYLEENVQRLVPDKNMYLIMVDVNKFKYINDTYGHTVGDRALIAVADMIGEKCKKYGEQDFLARYGGDEFVIVCLRRDEEELRAFIDRIHEGCKELKDRCGFEFTISLSIGYAEYSKVKYTSIEEYINAADSKMYEDKNDVQNR